MPGRLQNKVAIITGSSSGIGRAIALLFHNEGAHIICADIRDTSNCSDGSNTPTHSLITQAGGQAIFCQVDVSIPSQVSALVARAVGWGGRLDIMVSNAGITLEGEAQDGVPVWDTALETWEMTQKINSSGVFLGTKFAAKQMLSQPPHENGDRGWIINVASVLGLVGEAGTPAYCASKGAVVALTRSAAVDCGRKGSRVNAVCPGYTASSMTKPLFDNPEYRAVLQERHPLGERLGEPEDIARACVFLASEDASWVNGVALPVDGGYTAR